MEPKYLAEEVIVHPNHHLTFGDWIPRVRRFRHTSCLAVCFACMFGSQGNRSHRIPQNHGVPRCFRHGSCEPRQFHQCFSMLDRQHGEKIKHCFELKNHRASESKPFLLERCFCGIQYLRISHDIVLDS